MTQKETSSASSAPHDNIAYGRQWRIHYWQIGFSDEVAILLSMPTPDGLAAPYAKQWDGFNRREHPYNETPFAQDGRTDIATVLTLPSAEASYRYSLYLGLEGAIAPEIMRQKVGALKGCLVYGR
jgi:hypothetical protein